jgi:hypothetical protein
LASGVFNKTLEYLTSLTNNLEDNRVSLLKLYGAVRRINNAVSKGEAELARLNNPTKVFAEIEKTRRGNFLSLAKAILYNKALEASRINQEFSREPYWEALESVIEDDATYRLTFRGTGWNKRAVVQIILDRSAGRLTDWGRATKQYRNLLGVKVPKKGSKKREISAMIASKVWARIYKTQPDTFEESVLSRIALSGRPAAFWQLLDKGAVPLVSDRGGYPTPTKKPTNFVVKAEVEANQELENYFLSLRSEIEKFVSDIKSEIEKLASLREIIRENIERLKLDNLLKKKVIVGLGISPDDVNEEKLLAAIQKARDGVQGRMNIGSGKRKLMISYKSIRNMIRGV